MIVPFKLMIFNTNSLQLSSWRPRI